MKYTYFLVFIIVFGITILLTAIVMNILKPKDNIAPRRTAAEYKAINPDINKVITGKVVNNPPSTIVDSYCAGGSDFYMIDADAEAIVLEESPEISKSKFKELKGMEVELMGNLHEITINCEQGLECPDSPDGIFKCERLKVLGINKIE